MSCIVNLDIPKDCYNCKLKVVTEKNGLLCLPLSKDVTEYAKKRHEKCIFKTQLSGYYTKIVDAQGLLNDIKKHMIQVL